MPWKAVRCGGTERIRSGSTIEISGKVWSLPKPIFSWVSSLVITVHGSASVPVPAVVVMAMIGSAPLGTGLAWPLPPPM